MSVLQEYEDIMEGLHDAIRHTESAIDALDGMIEFEEQIKDLKATLVDLLRLYNETKEIYDQIQREDWEVEVNELNSWLDSLGARH